MAGSVASGGKDQIVVEGFDFELFYAGVGDLEWCGEIKLPFADRDRRFGGKKHGFELLAWEWQVRGFGQVFGSQDSISLLPRYQPQLLRYCAQWGSGALAHEQGTPDQLRSGYRSYQLQDGSSGIVTYHDILFVYHLAVQMAAESYIQGSVRLWLRPFWASALQYGKWEAPYFMRSSIDKAPGAIVCRRPYNH